MKFHKSILVAVERFAAGRGFAVLTVVCVAVITATALWTRQSPAPVGGTSPTGGNLPAAALWQQPLPVTTPTPLPTRQPLLWRSPLPEIDVLRPFSPDVMLKSGVTGLWATHAAVDLAAGEGDPVAAMAPGNVLDCGTQQLQGTWISIAHDDGYISHYAGLSLLGAFRAGDPVSAGQTIGFVGNSVVSESDLPPHLHLQLLHYGEPVDPLSVLQ